MSMNLEDTGQMACYAVTARHVIEKVRLNSCDSTVWLRINISHGGFAFFETKIDDWHFHPTKDSVDAAALQALPFHRHLTT